MNAENTESYRPPRAWLSRVGTLSRWRLGCSAAVLSGAQSAPVLLVNVLFSDGAASAATCLQWRALSPNQSGSAAWSSVLRVAGKRARSTSTWRMATSRPTARISASRAPRSCTSAASSRVPATLRTTSAGPSVPSDNSVLAQSWLLEQIKADPEAWLGKDGVIAADGGASDGGELLLNPILGAREPQDCHYNFCHSLTRFFVEETFGRWKNRFWFLLRESHLDHI